MFARLYLICRCIMFHSHLVRNAPLKSLGSFNQVPINITFLMKTYLEQWPTRSIIISCCLMFFIGSWSLRACDYKPTVVEHISMFNSMWLFIITFTTVGMQFSVFLEEINIRIYFRLWRYNSINLLWTK